ncbi:MAG: hypothetical protein GX256_09805 [Fretibacterium sp.]|nr:hypothetical protein [Fretibacterium sp.]
MLSSEFLLDLAARIRQALETSKEFYASELDEGAQLPEDVNLPCGSSSPASQPEELRGDVFYRKLFELSEQSGVSVSDACSRLGLTLSALEEALGRKKSLPSSRETAMAFALALELDPGQAEELLVAAGYAFDDQEVYDHVILYCIEHRVFALQDVNEALQCFNLKPFKTIFLPPAE